MDQINLERAVALRHELHAHPEVSCQEKQTKQRLMAFVRAHTDLEIVDCGRWFYARYRSGSDRPGIAFRADMDAIAMTEDHALPYHAVVEGAAHKCGHDGHSAALAAFAVEIAQKGAPRDVFFLFQHAEENGVGAFECCALLRDHNIDEVFAFHNMPGYPHGAVAIRRGTINCASKGVAIRLTGAPSHASMPEQGNNPAFAAADIINAVPDLVLPGQYQGLVLCTIVHIHMGERAFGISPGEAEICFTCRGEYERDMESLIAKLEQAVAQNCQKHGLTFAITYADPFPETFNHSASVDKIERACASQGRACIAMPDPIRSSEDFGHYTKHTGGAIFYLGAGDVPGIHTAGYDFDDSLIPIVVELFSAIAHDIGERGERAF